MKNLFLILLLIIPCLLKAQERNKVLIRAGKMFNSETGVFSNDMALLIEGKKIKIIEEAIKNKSIVNITYLKANDEKSNRLTNLYRKKKI